MSKGLLDILDENKIEYKQSSGGRYVAQCPFHEGDNTASFTIYDQDNYFCFGCHAWGDAIKFLCDYKGLTHKEAEEIVGVAYEYTKADKAKVIKFTNLTATWSFLARVAELYHIKLLKTHGAWDYLTRRGLSDQTIWKYKLGYSDGRTLNFQFASDYNLAVSAGILTKDGWELMSHRITVPNFVNPTSVDFIMGRTVTNDKIKYLGTRVPKPIYGFAENAKSPVLFLAEGQFDWLLLSQWGYPAIVLSGSHLPQYHTKLLRNKLIIIIPDNDNPGQKSARELHSTFNNSIILDYTKLGVKDIGELGPMEDGEKLFSEIVKEQEWYNTLMLKETYQKYLPNFLITG